MENSRKIRTTKDILDEIKMWEELGVSDNKILNDLNDELDYIKRQQYWLYPNLYSKEDIEKKSQNNYRLMAEKNYYLPPENIFFLMEYFKTYINRVLFLYDILKKHYPGYIEDKINSIIENEEYERMFFLKRFQ